MKNEKISRRSFLKASAVASALGVMAAAPAAHAAGADAAAAQIDNFHIRSVHRSESRRTVEHKFHITCSRRLF